MKKLFFFFFVISFSSAAQEKNTIVYLVGDAGEDTVAGPALRMLKDEMKQHPNSTVIFLGDNVYPNGLEKNNHRSEKHLLSQLGLLTDFSGQAYFIPGNHDWDGQKRMGLKRLKDEQEYIEDYVRKNTTIANKEIGTFLPANGFPGPSSVLLSQGLRLIIFDSQWFLHFYKKSFTGSKKETAGLFYERMDSILAFSAKNHEKIIVAAHHPMYTNGQHSKFKQPWRFLINSTPFQLFGLFGVNRLYSQDIEQPRYKRMRKRMLAILSKYEGVYVSGHDHNLQCFKEGSMKYIVSGAGSKLSHLRKKKRFDSVFQDDSRTGFVKLEYLEDGTFTTTIFRSGEKEMLLKDF